MNGKSNIDPYTNELQRIKEDEKEYIDGRRSIYKLEPIESIDHSWAICFSGGGIRSATLCLGIMQKFIKKNIFKKFDYLSTVSGGGYIGSCLTSLLSGKRQNEDKTFEVGVEPANSPFVGLNEFDDYSGKTDVKLGVRHQMHHLRTHGEYLIPQKGILSRDKQRALGNIFVGILHHIFLYALLIIALVSLIHFILFTISGYPSDIKAKLASANSKLDSLEIATPFLAPLNYFDTKYFKITLLE